MAEQQRTYDDRDPDGLCELTRTAHEGEETVFEVAREILGENDDGSSQTLSAVSVSRRKLQPEKPLAPDRMESPRRAHQFHSVEGLAAYLVKYGTPENVVVLADVNEGTMDAVLDEEAESGFEVVQFVPTIHPLFAPWMEILGKRVTVKDFAAFIMENRRVITEPDGKDVAMTFRQVHAAVHTEIAQGIGNGSVNGMMVTSKIQGKDKTEAVDLPDTITIYVPIYVSTPPVFIEIDLIVMADGQNGVTVTASASTVIDAKVQAFTGMVKQIEQAVKGATVGFGTVNHNAWTYLS